MTSSCPICCEEYTKQLRSKIVCPNNDCNNEVCTACIKQYLLSTTKDAHCMGCKMPYEYKYLVEIVSNNWLTKDYQKHRKKLLLDREISQIPATMDLANRTIEIDNISLILDDIYKKKKELREALKLLDNNRNELIRKQQAIRRGQGEGDKKKKFIMACPDPDCRGFLSTNYKCGVCSKWTCSKCIELVGEHAELEYHECNPDNVKSAELIKKDTKPCPACGERIYKIEGCDQMWCVSCNIAFSWNTGVIDNGKVHNPHFFEHLNNQGQGFRNPGDQVCGGLPNWWGMQDTLKQFILYPSTEKYWKEALEIHNNEHFIKNRLAVLFANASHFIDRQNHMNPVLWRYCQLVYRKIVEFQRYHLDTCRTGLTTYQNNSDLRIAYILKKINEKELSTKILRKDKLRKKYRDTLYIYELLHAVSIDCFRLLERILNDFKNHKLSADYTEPISQIFTQFIQLEKTREYCNKELMNVSKIYKNQVIQINIKWGIVYSKYNSY